MQPLVLHHSFHTSAPVMMPHSLSRKWIFPFFLVQLKGRVQHRLCPPHFPPLSSASSCHSTQQNVFHPNPAWLYLSTCNWYKCYWQTSLKMDWKHFVLASLDNWMLMLLPRSILFTVSLRPPKLLRLKWKKKTIYRLWLEALQQMNCSIIVRHFTGLKRIKKHRQHQHKHESRTYVTMS